MRAFNDADVVHVDTEHDPKKDIEVINTELILADLQTIDRRIPKAEKEARVDPKLKPAYETLLKAQKLLDAGTPLSATEDINLDDIKDLQLLTAKPVVYLFNVDEETLADTSKKEELQKLVLPAQAVFVCAKLENELQTLDETDRAELLNSYGVSESGLVQLTHAAYKILGLQSYLTAGEQEVRAWTIAKGSTAPQAAGVIHGDFERGFIAAQIVSYADLIASGSEAAAKAAGKIRTEGKTYVMQPDDVVEFRFNV